MLLVSGCELNPKLRDTLLLPQWKASMTTTTTISGLYVKSTMALSYVMKINAMIENILLLLLGVSNTIGRVLAGWFSDFSWVDSLIVTNLAIFLSGVSVFVLPFCTSYGMFVFVALMFGFFVAAYISLTSIVLVDLLGLDNLTSAFGLLVLYRSV